MTRKPSILGPIEQRVYGLLHIAMGTIMLIIGHRAPHWPLRYIKIKSKQKAAR